jgi:excisionase family DNA binding protein
MTQVVEGGSLVDAAHVAGLLNVPKSWVREMTRRGEIPGAIRLGKYVRYDVGTVRSWIDKRAQGGEQS